MIFMIFWALLLLAIPFVLPIVSLVSQGRLRARLTALEEKLDRQRHTIEELMRRLSKRPEVAVPAQQFVPQPADRAAEPVAAPSPVVPPLATPPVVPLSVPVPRSAAPPPQPVAPQPTPVVVSPPIPKPPAPVPVQPAPRPVLPPATPTDPTGVSQTVYDWTRERERRLAPPLFSIDWEDLVGVKLFSAVAGIALVLAAIFFLRYSIEHGWLAPPVRVAIGVIVATALLGVCERKAARKYAVTANALDAAAIAILFSTFFAAHALWQLIPTVVTFALLALVTVLAALLSIRRDSLFIAVLGLLGGFATPALLSTGENLPVPLFTYLLLLNAGLAWVAYRKRWPLLTILTLVFTAIYQWGWVTRFLTVSQLSLAMGIFLVFSVASFTALTLGRRGLRHGDAGGESAMDLMLERTGLAASAMPIIFTIYLAAVPAYGAQAALLFGFLLALDAGLFAIAVGRREELLHAIGGGATLLVFAIWLAVSYASSLWMTVTAFAAVFIAFYALAPLVARRVGRPFKDLGTHAVYTAPLLLFVFPVIARIEPAAESPLLLFGTMFLLLALLAWRALATSEPALYFVAAFFGVAAQASWSVTYLVASRLGAALTLYTAFGIFYLGVPLIARRLGRRFEPRWGAGAVLMASLGLLLFLASGPQAAAALWGLALLLAILDAGLFIESASGSLPVLSAAGGGLSWIVLAVWWRNAAAVVGVLQSLLVLVGLTLVMLVGHAWAHADMRRAGDNAERTTVFGFQHGSYLGLIGHLFLFFVVQRPEWSNPPWPVLGALLVLTLAVSAASLAVEAGVLHAAGAVAAATIVFTWAETSLPAQGSWAPVALVVAEAVVAYALGWRVIARRADTTAASIAAATVLFIGELTVTAASVPSGAPPLAAFALVHVVNLSLILAIAWKQQWPWVAPAAVAPAWLAAAVWQRHHADPTAWQGALVLATSLYAVFTAYPFVLGRRARDARDPHLTAVVGSVFFFFAARSAFLLGGLTSIVGVVPIAEGVVMALLLRKLLSIQPPGSRDLGRLAIVAGTALAFATVAIPLQLRQQWITIGWALEGAALAWLYRRVPHRGLLYSALALLSTVFVRLALNPAVFVYEPRGMRVFNWYFYTYLTCGAALGAAARWFSGTDDRIVENGNSRARASALLPAGGVILLFLLLNIEIADFYATGREIMFRFGVTLAQDLTYTIGWLLFGLAVLTAGIYLHNRPGRIAAVSLIAVTACKAFLYDMGSLGGLYRVASLVGLALSLSLVALALQKFVLQVPKEAS